MHSIGKNVYSFHHETCSGQWLWDNAIMPLNSPGGSTLQDHCDWQHLSIS